MKCLLLADNRPELLATLEPILKHWGYRVVSARNAWQTTAFLRESTPCLLIIGQRILTDESLELGTAIRTRITGNDLPLIVLRQGSDQPLPIIASEVLEVPVDIFALFAFIQRHVEKHPRQNLRLSLQLPGMYQAGSERFLLADVMSLSTQGLFFKSATRLSKGDIISVVIPLLGHGKELEVEARVLYVIDPQISNNFMQGFGAGFTGLSNEQKASLHGYIEDLFLNEVSTHLHGVGDFSAQQIRR